MQENDFDAWGRKRNPTDWSFNSVPTANLFDRGYTGHEHLDIFGLINMNGRMYDPVLGKMLSPDLVVQDPGYTESYNRYTYCFNNPLKFTDPSGYEGEGWSQGVWNSHLVDWKAEGWYNMNAQQRSDWYAGNRGSNAVDAETNRDYGLRGSTMDQEMDALANSQRMGSSFYEYLYDQGYTFDGGRWTEETTYTPSLPSFMIDGVDYSPRTVNILVNVMAAFNEFNQSQESEFGNTSIEQSKYGYFMSPKASLGDFVGLIYGNAVNMGKSVSHPEMSGFATQAPNGDIRYWINSQEKNGSTLSKNFEGHVRSLGYKILFQLHSHAFNEPSGDDMQAQLTIGADVYIVTSEGNIYSTIWGYPTSGKPTGSYVGYITDYQKIFGQYFPKGIR